MRETAIFAEALATKDEGASFATVLAYRSAQGQARIELSNGQVINAARVVGITGAGARVRVSWQAGEYVVYGQSQAPAASSASSGSSGSGLTPPVGGGYSPVPAPHGVFDTLYHTWPTFSANQFLAAPVGGSGQPVIRQIVLSDIQSAADSRYVQMTRTVTGANGVTGGGALTGDLVLQLGTPTTLTVATINQSAGATHQHAITTTVVGAASTIVATGTLGEITAFRFDAVPAGGTGGSVRVYDRSNPALYWSTYHSNGTYVWFNGNTASDVVWLKQSGALQSPGYVSQTTGLQADFGTGSIDARYIYVDEMHAKSFIADLEQALAGAQIISKSVMMLYRPFTAPAAGATATLTCRDLPSAPGMLGFVASDYIRVRQFSRAAGSLTIADCWGTVQPDTTYIRTFVITATGGTFTLTSTTTTSALAWNAAPATVQSAIEVLASVGVGNVSVTGSAGNMTIQFIGTKVDTSMPLTVNTGSLTGGTATLTPLATDSATTTQRWTITRSTGSPQAGTMTAGTVIQPDAVILDYGTAGNGIAEVNAIDGAYAINSPYYRVATWSTHPSQMTERTRIGNLRGITSTANEFGLYAGDGGIGSTNRYIRLSNTNFEIRNIDFVMINGSSQTTFLINASTPYLALGIPAPSGYLNGTGVWMGLNSGVYKYHVGVATGGTTLTRGMSWDGTTLNLVSAQDTISLSSAGLAISAQSGFLNEKHSAISYGLANGTRVFYTLSTSTSWYWANTNGPPTYAVASYVQYEGGSPYRFIFAGGGIRSDALIPAYAQWNAYGVGDGGAAIYNDNNVYQALMVAGNTSAGGNRLVRLYDDVIVAGSLLSENSQGFTGRREGTQSINNATWSDCQCTHDDIDNYGLFDGTSFVVPSTGFYTISGKVTWAGNATGNRFIAIYNNNSGVYLYTDFLRGGSSADVHHSISAVLYLTAGHAIRLRVYQDSGAAINISHASDANAFTRFGAHRLN